MFRVGPIVKSIRPRRGAGWVWVGLTAGIALNGRRLRRRVHGLPVLSGTVRPDAARSDFVLVRGAGVDVDDATLTAAIAYATEVGADVVDLVPGDLPLDEIVDLARMFDAGSYATDPLAPGRGPLQALVVRSTVLERAGLGEGLTDGRAVEPEVMRQLVDTLKKFAPTTTHTVVAPLLVASPFDAGRRASILRTMYGPAHPLALGLQFVEPVVIAAGLLVSPGWATAAACAYWSQPFLVGAGSGIASRDRRLPAALAHPLRRLRTLAPIGAAAGDLDRSAADELAVARDAARIDYQKSLADGLDRFFEPRRTTCPLCAGEELVEVVRVADRLQAKPGTFVLDRCEACDHIFQNPRLSLDGLDFYYRDFYDGIGESGTDLVFAMSKNSYQGRIDMVRDAAEVPPARWLDVGTGHGHFCIFAAQQFTDTVFDGLDIGPSIIEAEQRGWVREGIQGLFPEAAPGLAGTYDVVSMHHYLEHTREPIDELRAAWTALAPGGLLMIEVPDPECRMGDVLGSLWGPWFQPQHQHFVSAGNLERLLGREGFDVIAVDRTGPHQPVDAAFAAMMLTEQLAPLDDRAWLEPTTPGERAGRTAVYALAAPVLAGAVLADHVAAPLVRRIDRGSNTYRLLARKPR